MKKIGFIFALLLLLTPLTAYSQPTNQAPGTVNATVDTTDLESFFGAATFVFGDDTANPTAGLIGSFLFGYDGTAWDRLTATGGSLNVNITGGSSAGPSDTDDGSIAGGQSVGLNVALGKLWDGAAWVRMPGDTTNGVTVNLGSNNDVVVSATNLDVQSGGADLATSTQAAAIQAAVETIDNAVSGAGFNITQFGGAAVPMTTTQADDLANTLDGLNTTSFLYGYDGTTWDRVTATAGSLNVNITGGAGSGGTAIADDADVTPGTTSFTPIGGLYETTVTNCTLGDGCMAGITEDRELKVVLSSGGTPVTLASDAVFGTTTYTETSSSGPIIGAVRNDTLAALANTDNEIAPLQVNADGAMYVAPVGNVAHDAAASGTNPVLVGGYASATVPTAVSTATDAVRAWLTLNGALVVANTDPCSRGTKVYVPISQATSTELFTGTASSRTFICSISIMQRASSTQTWSLVSGTGTTCGTSTSGVIGGTTAANGTDLSMTQGNGGFTILKTDTDADNVCLLQSSTDRINGFITYVVAANQ